MGQGQPERSFPKGPLLHFYPFHSSFWVIHLPLKMELIAHFYVGDMVTKLQKTSIVPGSDDALVYTTISGSIGMLVPFLSRDVIIFARLGLNYFDLLVLFRSSSSSKPWKCIFVWRIRLSAAGTTWRIGHSTPPARSQSSARPILFICYFQFVVDGDLCEQFATLDPSKQREIAANLGHKPGVVVKKLEDLRTRYAF